MKNIAAKPNTARYYKLKINGKNECIHSFLFIHMFFSYSQECLYLDHRVAVLEFPGRGPRISRRFPKSSAKASDWKSSTKMGLVHVFLSKLIIDTVLPRV